MVMRIFRAVVFALGGAVVTGMGMTALNMPEGVVNFTAGIVAVFCFGVGLLTNRWWSMYQ